MQANYAVASEQNTIIKGFHVAVNCMLPIFWGLELCGGRKLGTDRQHVMPKQLLSG